jgi:hypothetical protein
MKSLFPDSLLPSSRPAVCIDWCMLLRPCFEEFLYHSSPRQDRANYTETYNTLSKLGHAADKQGMAMLIKDQMSAAAAR